MSKDKVNTTKSVKGKSVTMAELDKQVKNAAKVLKDGKTAEVLIPKMLEQRLGKNVPVAVQGAIVHVPVGKKVKIPEPMAEVLNNMLNELTL